MKIKRYFIISLIAASIVGIVGVFSVGRSGDTPAVIKDAESKFSKAFELKSIPVPEKLKGKITTIEQLTPEWSEIEKISEPLTWHNKRILDAKAMLRYDFYIENMNRHIWQERESFANEPWEIEETNQFYLRKFLGGLTYAAIGFVATLLLLMLISWSWKFLLTRIREVSDAIRGSGK